MHRINRQSIALRKTTRRQWVTAGVCICLAALIWAVFGQTLRHDFVNYDDPRYVYQNARITSGLNIAGVAWAFTHIHAENWHPLTTITHMLDCQLYGLNAGGHHFTNVLFHTVAVVLLFLAFQQMTGALWRSAFVAAVFAIHPLHVESVAWVAERKDVLSGVFFMLTLLASVHYARAPSIWRYLMVVFVFALGLMSKPMLVTLPFVLLLLDYWPLRRITDQRSDAGRQLLSLLLEKIPLIALSAVSSVVTFLAQRGALGWTEQLPMLARVNNALVTYLVYVLQMFWPVNLDQPGLGRFHWGYHGSGYSAKESAVSHHRVVLVSWHACSSNRIGASRMAGTCRSIHVSATDRPLHRWYVGCCRFNCFVAPPTYICGRGCAARDCRVNLLRLDPNILLAR